MKNKFSIITPCLNAEKYISETIPPVLSQKEVVWGACDLEYIVCDGGSSDGTLNIIESYRSENKRDNITIKLMSAHDDGMYHALSKGLKQVTGDICAYLNADDFYSPNAFDVVSEIFRSQHVKWLTGLSAIYNVYSQVVGFSLPYKYRKRFFECGFYGSRLPFVQQESTFWHHSSNVGTDHDRLSEFKLAGDYYLWEGFSKTNQLHIVEAYLGGFRIHSDQLTSRFPDYFKEVTSICRRPQISDQLLFLWDYVLWKSPRGLKKIFNRSNLFRFNHTELKWE